MAVARKERIPQTPQEIIKDPMVLEFLGLERKAAYYEFPAFRRYEILADKGNVSRQAALKKPNLSMMRSTKRRKSLLILIRQPSRC